MTELAYLADLPSAYVRRFRGRVTALPPGAVVLDRTYFYATGGGQPADRGWLADGGGHRFEVVDVSRSGSSVVHRIRASAEATRHLAVGAELEGDLDWVRRYRHMRLHSGQHLASALIFSRWGRRTRHAELGGASATIDLEGALDARQLEETAEEIRRAVAQARSVRLRFVPRAEWDAHPAGRSGLVPLPPNVDPVRVVEIEGADVCPCGGTHVRSTAEIGDLRFDPPQPRAADAARIRFTLATPDQPTPNA